MQKMNTPRVLYIEDHEDTRELVTLVLEQKSYEVVTGSTIKNGVELAGSQDFDLYLLDSWLPDGSGWICAGKYVSSTKQHRLFFTRRSVRDGSQ